MKLKLNCLWSGGLDSTIAMCFFADCDFIIQPYHILIRNGGGKDAREIEAIKNLYPLIKGRFPTILEPIEFKHKISPCNDRNEKMILLLKEKYDISNCLLGNHVSEREGLENDTRWEYLEEKTKIPIIDLRRMGIETKKEQFALGITLLGDTVLKLTWSCQLWWKKPCGKCFSCKKRNFLFTLYK